MKHIEIAVKKIANHFSKNRYYINDYLDVIRKSKRWTINTLNNDLQLWEKRFKRANPDGTDKIIEITKEAFNNCKDENEINKLRGAILEAILIGINGGFSILQEDNYGWGASVSVQEDNSIFKIKYECINPINSDCHRRMTVDFGAWNGKHAKVYECKAAPDRIGCKEVNYMKVLKKELLDRDITNEVFYVCPSPNDAIQIQLDKFDLSPVYKTFGKADFKAASATL